MPAERRRELSIRIADDTAANLDRLALSLTGQHAAPFIASVIEQLRPQIDRALAATDAAAHSDVPPLLSYLATIAGGIEPLKRGPKPRKQRTQPDGEACTAKEDAA